MNAEASPPCGQSNSRPEDLFRFPQYPRWMASPEIVARLHRTLPQGMRPVSGILGLIGGVTIVVILTVVLLGGNWQLGFGDDRPLVLIFGLGFPAAVGITSPLWFWVGRPVWVHYGRPGEDHWRSLYDVKFLPGLAGSLVGVLLVLPVSATSPLPVQVLAPFGIGLGIVAPAWYWGVGPVFRPQTDALLAEASSDSIDAIPGARTGVGLVVLLVLSAVVTTAIALPVVGTGETITSGGLTVTVDDTTTVESVTAIDDGEVHGTDSWRLLLVSVTVENRATTPQEMPGTSVGDVTVISPACGVQNFGEPAYNCNQVFLDGRFTGDGTEYPSYSGGTIAPGEQEGGWLVYRLEQRPDRRGGPRGMIIVDDVGRWELPVR